MNNDRFGYVLNKVSKISEMGGLISNFADNMKGILYSVLFAGIIVCSTWSAAMAQLNVEVGVGASGMYNFQTEGFGAGARVEVFLIRSVSVMVHGMYYPSPNKVHEVFGGLDVHYAPYYHPIVRAYVLVGGDVNYWFNFAESNYKKAKPLNFIAEVGGGLVFLDKQLRPFVEYRYNPIFLEGSIHVGLMYFPKIKKRNKYTCPAYL